MGKKRVIGACALVAVLAGIAYARLPENGFVDYDDVPFIVESSATAGGAPLLAAWGFTAETYWHPVAVTSLAATRAIFGLNPAAYHLENLVWHVAAAVLLVVLGGRAVRARVDGGRVTVRPAIPLAPMVTAPLGRFAGVAVETMADERRRRAEALARRYAERAGGDLPRWFARKPTPGANDHLQRLVLVPAAAGEPLAVTAWLAPEDDLGPARRALEARLGLP